MKGKKGGKLSDYPLRLLRVHVCKTSGEFLFNRPLWLTAAGKKRMELSLSDIFNSYRQRFDTEHFFRFGKNRLLMDKIQTPDVRHEESWWQLVMIAYAQLYLSRSLASVFPNPWEKYNCNRENDRVIKEILLKIKSARVRAGSGTPTDSGSY
jgi:hypothetical protein